MKLVLWLLAACVAILPLPFVNPPFWVSMTVVCVAVGSIYYSVVLPAINPNSRWNALGQLLFGIAISLVVTAGAIALLVYAIENKLI